MYYTVEEMSEALQRAVNRINLITKDCENYTRGTNDCFALFAEYDYQLRGEASKARDLIKFLWNSPREFVVKLAREGYSIYDFAEYCNYRLVSSKRPELGDVAFLSGVFICDGEFWVSPKETNEGICNKLQVMPVETRMTFIARPIRS